MQECPKCHLINPEGAISCDCGYNFVKGEVESVPDQKESHENTASESFGKKVVGWCLFALAITLFMFSLQVRGSVPKGVLTGGAVSALLVAVRFGWGRRTAPTRDNPKETPSRATRRSVVIRPKSGILHQNRSTQKSRTTALSFFLRAAVAFLMWLFVVPLLFFRNGVGTHDVVMVQTVDPTSDRLVRRRMDDRVLESRILEVYEEYGSSDACRAWLVENAPGQDLFFAGIRSEVTTLWLLVQCGLLAFCVISVGFGVHRLLRRRLPISQ